MGLGFSDINVHIQCEIIYTDFTVLDHTKIIEGFSFGYKEFGDPTKAVFCEIWLISEMDWKNVIASVWIMYFLSTYAYLVSSI